MECYYYIVATVAEIEVAVVRGLGCCGEKRLSCPVYGGHGRALAGLLIAVGKKFMGA